MSELRFFPPLSWQQLIERVESLPGNRSSGTAGSSEDAADRIISAMNDRGERLRRPLDDTGQWVFRTLRLDAEVESGRDSILHKVSGLDWGFEPGRSR